MNNLLNELQNFTFSSDFIINFVSYNFLQVEFLMKVKTEINDEVNKSELLSTNKSEEFIKYYANTYFITIKKNLIKIFIEQDKFWIYDNLIYDLKYQDVNFYIENEKKWAKFNEINSSYDLKDMLIRNTDICKIDHSVFFDPEKLINNILELVKADKNQNSKKTIIINFNADIFYYEAIMDAKTFEKSVLWSWISDTYSKIFTNKNELNEKWKHEIDNIKKTYNVEFYITLSRIDYLVYYYNILETKYCTIECKNFSKLTDEAFSAQQNMLKFFDKLFDFKNKEKFEIHISN